MSPVRKFTDKICSVTNNLKIFFVLNNHNKDQFSNGMRKFLGGAIFLSTFSFAFFVFAAVQDTTISNPTVGGVPVCGDPSSINQYCLDNGYLSGRPGTPIGGGICKVWTGSWTDANNRTWNQAICRGNTNTTNSSVSSFSGSLTASVVSSCQINLSLSADPSASSYVLQYTTTPLAPNFSNVPGYDGQAVEFSHSGISPNTKAIYRYKIIFDGSESGWFYSSEVDTGDFLNPGVPTNVSGFGTDGGRQVEVGWSPSTFDVVGTNKGYELERSSSANGSTWSTWSLVKKDTISNYPSISGVLFFPDNNTGSNLEIDRAYKHRIRSFQNNLGCVPAREKQSAWVEIQTPTTPTDLNVDYPFGVGTPPVSVDWLSSIGASTYKINGTSTVNSVNTNLSISDQSSTSYTINNPIDGATYTFSVRGCTSTSCSDSTTNKGAIVDNSPNELISRIFYIDEAGKKAKLNLSWLDNLKNGANEPDYQFEKSINDGAFVSSNIGTSARFKTSRPQNGVVETFDEVDLNKTYKYKVQGKLLSATSAFSKEASIDTKIKYLLRGAAWSGYKDASDPAGLGWLAMSSDGLVGYTADKKWNVSISQDGFMSGVAWAEADGKSGYGWLSFNREDLVGCPDNTAQNCVAKLIPSGEIRGWARFIGLKGTTYEWVSLSNIKIDNSVRTSFLDEKSGLEKLWQLVWSPDGESFLERLASRASALFSIAVAANDPNYGLKLTYDEQAKKNAIIGEVWNPALGWVVFTDSLKTTDKDCGANSRCLVTVETVNTPPVISEVKIEAATLGELGDFEREGPMWCAEQPAYKISWHYFDADGDIQASSTIKLIKNSTEIFSNINRLGPIAKVISTDPDANARYKIIATEFKPLIDLGLNKSFFARIQSEDGRGLLSAVDVNSDSLATTTPTLDYPLISVVHEPIEMKVNEPVKFSSNITRVALPFSSDWTFASGTPKKSDKSTTTAIFSDVINNSKAYNLTIKKGENQCGLWGGNVGGSKGEKPPRSLEEN